MLAETQRRKGPYSKEDVKFYQPAKPMDLFPSMLTTMPMQNEGVEPTLERSQMAASIMEPMI